MARSARPTTKGLGPNARRPDRDASTSAYPQLTHRRSAHVFSHRSLPSFALVSPPVLFLTWTIDQNTKTNASKNKKRNQSHLFIATESRSAAKATGCPLRPPVVSQGFSLRKRYGLPAVSYDHAAGDRLGRQSVRTLSGRLSPVSALGADALAATASASPSRTRRSAIKPGLTP